MRLGVSLQQQHGEHHTGASGSSAATRAQVQAQAQGGTSEAGIGDVHRLHREPRGGQRPANVRPACVEVCQGWQRAQSRRQIARQVQVVAAESSPAQPSAVSRAAAAAGATRPVHLQSKYSRCSPCPAVPSPAVIPVTLRACSYSPAAAGRSGAAEGKSEGGLLLHTLREGKGELRVGHIQIPQHWERLP